MNASRPPGEWQSFDVIFMAPRFRDDGSVVEPATISVLRNGVLIQNHVTIEGSTVYIGKPEYEAHDSKASLMLQDQKPRQLSQYLGPRVVVPAFF